MPGAKFKAVSSSRSIRRIYSGGDRVALRAILLSLRLADPALSRLHTDGRRQKRIGLSTTPRRKRHVRHRHYGAETALAVPPLEL